MCLKHCRMGFHEGPAWQLQHGGPQSGNADGAVELLDEVMEASWPRHQGGHPADVENGIEEDERCQSEVAQRKGSNVCHYCHGNGLGVGPDPP